jgi:hypothetical protein
LHVNWRERRMRASSSRVRRAVINAPIEHMGL